MSKRTIRRTYRQASGLRDAHSCAYCGEPAEHHDHVLPVRYSNHKASLNDAEKAQLVTVPACAECNHLAGARAFSTIQEKRDHIRSQLRRKYHKLLQTPRWGQDEIDELEGRLRSFVVGSQPRAQLIRMRLNYDGLPSSTLRPHELVPCGVCGELDWCNAYERSDGELKLLCGDCWEES